MTFSSLILRYSEDLPWITKLEARVKGVLRQFCEENNFLFEGRIKSRESVAGKLETGRYSQWGDIDDLYACSVVINLPSDEEAVLLFLSNTFIIDESKSRYKDQQKKPADVFRYDSTRIYCKLKIPSHIENPERFYKIFFEIQIRTIFDYAWAKATHALAYKSPVVDWRRQRLAAQLKAATEQIETLVLAFDHASEYIGVSRSPNIEDQAKIHRFFKNLFDEKVFPEELEPSDWTRFSMNTYKIFQLASKRNPCVMSPYEYISGLDDLLKKIKTYVDVYYHDNKIPRSISLFQLVVCIIFDGEHKLKRRENYHLLVTNEMKDLFPTLSPPCSMFNLEREF